MHDEAGPRGDPPEGVADEGSTVGDGGRGIAASRGHGARWLGDWRAHLLVIGMWLAVVMGTIRVHVGGAVFAVALAGHLLGLVVGLGAVLLVDWYGLVWLSGLRTLAEVTRLAEAAYPLVWAGLGLLTGSGLLLSPDLGDPVAWVKQAMVLALLHNGVAVHRLSVRLRALHHQQPHGPASMGQLPSGLRTRVITAIVVSQFAWWTTATIGYVTATRRGE